MPRPNTAAQVFALLVFGYALIAGEPGFLVGVLGVALCAWGLARYGSVALRTVTGSGPSVAVRALRQARLRAMVPRQQDPDAAGHTRARAPSVLIPAV